MNAGEYLMGKIREPNGPQVKPPDPNTIKIDTAYIIKEKPKVKVVRGFFKANLNAIKSEEESMFDDK